MGFGASFDESNEASSPHQPQDSEKLPKTSLGRAEVHWATDFHVVGVDIAQNCIRCWRERLVLAFERVASFIGCVSEWTVWKSAYRVYVYSRDPYTHTHRQQQHLEMWKIFKLRLPITGKIEQKTS